eukprot:PhF_6_TR29213/c1_g1_i1/m.42740
MSDALREQIRREKLRLRNQELLRQQQQQQQQAGVPTEGGGILTSPPPPTNLPVNSGLVVRKLVIQPQPPPQSSDYVPEQQQQQPTQNVVEREAVPLAPLPPPPTTTLLPDINDRVILLGPINDLDSYPHPQSMAIKHDPVLWNAYLDTLVEKTTAALQATLTVPVYESVIERISVSFPYLCIYCTSSHNAKEALMRTKSTQERHFYAQSLSFVNSATMKCVEPHQVPPSLETAHSTTTITAAVVETVTSIHQIPNNRQQAVLSSSILDVRSKYEAMMKGIPMTTANHHPTTSTSTTSEYFANGSQ